MFIRTSRLFLRPAWREDAGALSTVLSDPAFQCDLGGTPWLEAMSDPETFLDTQRTPREPRLLIFRRTEGTPRLIGAAGLGHMFGRTEFGLWLERTERRRGFAREAGSALLSLAFDGLKLRQLWAPAMEEGAGSRLIARLGFRKPHKDSPSAVLHASDWAEHPPLAA